MDPDSNSLVLVEQSRKKKKLWEDAATEPLARPPIPVVCEQGGIGGKRARRHAQPTHQIIRRGSPTPQLFHRRKRRRAIRSAHRRHRALILAAEQLAVVIPAVGAATARLIHLFRVEKVVVNLSGKRRMVVNVVIACRSAVLGVEVVVVVAVGCGGRKLRGLTLHLLLNNVVILVGK